MATTPEAHAAASVEPRKPAPRVALLVGGLLVAGLIGYLLGSARPGVTETVGRAAVGSGVASIEADGVFYGMSESGAWIDEQGSFHEDGWPSCLTPGDRGVLVRFGAEKVELPDGSWYGHVAYVDCRSLG